MKRAAVISVSLFLSLPSLAQAHTITEQEIDKLDLANPVTSTVKPKARASQASCYDLSGAPVGRPGSVELIIASFTDSPQRQAELTALISRAVDISSGHLALESGQQKTFNFARGNSCSPQGLQIKEIKLEAAASQFSSTDDSQAFAYILEQMNKAWGYSRSKRIAVVNGYQAANVAGRGQMRGGASVAYIPAGSMPAAGNLAYTISHELLHNLGAVSPSSPNGSRGFHCSDTYDIMCYDDGTLSQPLRQLCPDSGALLPAFDCGNDDYFNPNPGPGSFLAQNPSLNIYNSAFLVECATQPQSCQEGQKPRHAKIILERTETDRASFTGGVEMLDYSNASHWVEWSSQGRPVGQSPRFNLESDHVKLDISGLKPGREYEVRLNVSNNFGEIQSAPINFTTQNQLVKISRLKAVKINKRIAKISFRSSVKADLTVKVGKTKKTLEAQKGINSTRVKLAGRGLNRVRVSPGEGYLIARGSTARQALRVR